MEYSTRLNDGEKLLKKAIRCPECRGKIIITPCRLCKLQTQVIAKNKSYIQT